MPTLNFVLPHWLYWSGLVLFPGLAWWLVVRARQTAGRRGPSLPLAYLFLVCAGFVGLHRFYLRSLWGFLFLPVFLGIVYSNAVVSQSREDVSRTRSEAERAATLLTRARAPVSGRVDAGRVAQLETQLTSARSAQAEAQSTAESRARMASILAGLMAAMLLGDAALMPAATRRRRERERAERAPDVHVPPPGIHEAGTGEDPTATIHTRVTDWIEQITVRSGEYVAYWSVIAVFFYYYEVVARYMFNSPTNWVHESMFLMFGMQYMLSGACAYQADQHVRVDVLYVKLSARGRAVCDIITSVFFFIFIGTMLWTGTRFALDAIDVGERSFTEWGVQYWPVKLMIPVGAALMLLQGLAKLIKDVVLVLQREA